MAIGYADDVGAIGGYFTAEARYNCDGTLTPTFADGGSRWFSIGGDGNDYGAGGVALPNGDIAIAATSDNLPVLASILTAGTQATPTITWPGPASIAYGTALGAAQLDATAAVIVNGNPVNVPGTFTYSPAVGTVLGAGSQTLSVSFTPTDMTDYTTATASAMIYVSQATPTLTWANPASIVYGTALGATQLDATASWVVGGQTVSVAGIFSYEPAAGTVLKAGNNKTLSVTFTPTDTIDYTTATASAMINVSQATPTINWANPPSIVYGTALSTTQLDATASWVVGGQTVSVAGIFSYEPAAATILTTGNDQTLSVSFTPDDGTDYKSTNPTVMINVAQATPTITWTNPDDITFGTPLGPTQLDATASVPGTFVYTPAATTILKSEAGQALSATFTPTDAADYKTVTTATTINVLPAPQKATPIITWPDPAGIAYGTRLGATQLDAAAAFGGTAIAGTFTYTRGSGTVLNAGPGQLLSVSFGARRHDGLQEHHRHGADQRGAVDADDHLGRSRRHPLWNVPRRRLDATASVAGVFTYSPAAGTVLNAGANQTLAVTFTPSDTTDYASATAYTHINVNPPPLVRVASVQVETVHLTKRKTATEIVITFSGRSNSVDADNLANYHLAAPARARNPKPTARESASSPPSTARLLRRLCCN